MSLALDFKVCIAEKVVLEFDSLDPLSNLTLKYEVWTPVIVPSNIL